MNILKTVTLFNTNVNLSKEEILLVYKTLIKSAIVSESGSISCAIRYTLNGDVIRTNGIDEFKTDFIDGCPYDDLYIVFILDCTNDITFSFSSNFAKLTVNSEKYTAAILQDYINDLANDIKLALSFEKKQSNRNNRIKNAYNGKKEKKKSYKSLQFWGIVVGIISGIIAIIYFIERIFGFVFKNIK